MRRIRTDIPSFPLRSTRRWPRRRRLVVVAAVLTPALALIAGSVAFAQAAAAPNPDCSLVVPADPLSAAGLATPYELKATNAKNGACHESDTGQAAFVQGTVIDPATGRISVYNPLVLDAGQKPAVPPVKPNLPAGAVVGLWFGYNGGNLTLVDSKGSIGAGRCVNGMGRSIFGQFAYCNAPAFFTAANAAIAARKLTVPALGTARDGKPCPSTRDFSVIDQDQSDNVTASYLISGKTTAQNTRANRTKLKGSKVQINGSDNLLVDEFVDKALGCTPFKAPDLADNGAMTTALALNELQAAAHQGAPVALVPPNDPMTLLGTSASEQKTSLYRAGVDQPSVANNANLARTYCQNMVSIQSARLQQDKALDVRVGSPDAAAANNLFTFLAQRLDASVTNLGCDKLLKIKPPAKLTLKNGVAVDATFGTGTAAAGGKPAPSPSSSPGKRPGPSRSAAVNRPKAAPSAAIDGRAGGIWPDPNVVGNRSDKRPHKY